jgi:hypothetical protein
MRLCLAIVALMLAAAPAAAGPCCGHATATYDVQPVVPVSIYRFEGPEPVTQIYIANQGPVFSGPGLYTYTNRYVPSFVPTPYPYVSGYDGWRGTPGCGCGAAHAYQTYTLPGYLGYRGHRAYHGYHSYRSYRHHPAPLATNVLPSRGY